jgi:hypothetical protein
VGRYFLDSSALAKLYQPEAGSDRVEAIFRQPQRRLIISRLTAVEMHSVFAGRVRMGTLNPTDAALRLKKVSGRHKAGQVIDPGTQFRVVKLQPLNIFGGLQDQINTIGNGQTISGLGETRNPYRTAKHKFFRRSCAVLPAIQEPALPRVVPDHVEEKRAIVSSLPVRNPQQP